MESRKLSDIERQFVPSNCPRCGNELYIVGKELRCLNSECEGSARADLQHWTAIIAEVDGLGGKIKDNFFDDYNIETVEDLYDKINEIKFGESATEKKLVEMKDKLTVRRVDGLKALVALNIPRLGWKSAEKIIASGLFSTLAGIPFIVDDTKDYNNVINEISKVVGQATAKSIELNINKIRRLRFLKGRVVVSTNINNSDSIESKGKVVITGKLHSGTRKEFENILINAGYELDGSINKNTLYLITNTPDSGSSKNRKADELGVNKITEDDFLKLIR